MKNFFSTVCKNSSLITKATLLALFISPVSTAIAQNKNTLGVRSYICITGSGHGASITPALFYRYNRTMISAGPVMNLQMKEVTGIQLGYEYAMTGACKKMATNHYNEKAELFAFGSLMYRPSACLSKKAVEMEQTAEMKTNPYESMKVTTFEAYAGFGLKVKVLKRLQWANSIGIGAYISPNSPSEIYRPAANATLMVRTGLYYSFQ